MIFNKKYFEHFVRQFFRKNVIIYMNNKIYDILLMDFFGVSNILKNRLHISQQLAEHIKPVIHNDATRIQVKTAPTIIAKCTPHIAVVELDIVATELINWSVSFFPFRIKLLKIAIFRKNH